jgi:hypothetical protein
MRGLASICANRCSSTFCWALSFALSVSVSFSCRSHNSSADNELRLILLRVMTAPNHDARLVDLAPTGLVIFGQIFARFGQRLGYAATFARLAILAMVARLQPVAACMLVQDCPAAIMRAMPSLRSASSGRPL